MHVRRDLEHLFRSDQQERSAKVSAARLPAALLAGRLLALRKRMTIQTALSPQQGAATGPHARWPAVDAIKPTRLPSNCKRHCRPRDGKRTPEQLRQSTLLTDEQDNVHALSPRRTMIIRASALGEIMAPAKSPGAQDVH